MPFPRRALSRFFFLGFDVASGRSLFPFLLLIGHSIKTLATPTNGMTTCKIAAISISSTSVSGSLTSPSFLCFFWFVKKAFFCSSCRIVLASTKESFFPLTHAWEREPAMPGGQGINMAGHHAEMAFIIFLGPFILQQGKTIKSLTLATLTSVVIIIINFVSAILVFGPGLVGNLVYPELELIRYVPPGGFFENLDPFILAIWLSSLFIKISLLLYISVIGLTHLLGLKDHKPFSLSMSVLMIGLSLFMVRSASELHHLFTHGLASFLVVPELIPSLYWLADRLKRDR